MSHKAFTQVSVFVLLLLAFLAIPGSAQAGGGCGGTYIVQGDETLDVIAWRCDTTVSALYAANPGFSGYLYAGQTLVIPGGDYNYYNNYNYYAPVSFSSTYIVQVGDTFSGIASRYGVSINDLRAANPYLWDINCLYAGQVIYVPASSWYPYVPTETPTSLSYGTVPSGTPKGTIILSNKANADVYVSLQGTTRDGVEVINEYSVSGKMKVNVPAGWYIYVAWVGGQKFEGQFNLGGGSDHVISFYSNKIVVE
jgi:LysM repeat protein